MNNPHTGLYRLNYAMPFVIYALFICLISYRVIPIHGGVINYGDGAYFWPQGGFDFLSTWYESDLGIPFIAQIFTAFLYIPNKLTELVTKFAGGDAYQSYLLYYLPIYTSCISAYFLGSRISGNIYYGYFLGFFIILNNFILEQLLAWPVSYFYCLTGLLLQALVLLEIHENGVSRGRVVALILISLFAHHPFLFACHILFLLVFLIFLCMERKMKWIIAFTVFGGVVLIQSYWIIPFLYNLTLSSASETYVGSDGALYGFLSTINYSNLFSLLNYPFLISPKIFNYIHNNAQIVFNYFLFLSVISLLLFVTLKREKPQKELLFYLFLFLLFFNFALGPKSAITGDLWWWGYRNIPGFGFLRSFNRFYILAIIALMVLGGRLIYKARLRYINIYLMLLILANFASHAIFLTGNMKGLIKAYNVPNEYYQLNQKYFSKKRGTLLSVPHTTYEAFNWSKNDRFDIYNNTTHFLTYFLSTPVILNASGTATDQRYPMYGDILAADENVSSFNRWDERIKKLSIQYVLVRKDQLDQSSGSSRIVSWSRYWSHFSDNPNYILREENQYFSLFELKDYQPIIGGENITFRRITQTKYELMVNNLDKPTILRFSQGYHPDWKIYSQNDFQGVNNGSGDIHSKDAKGEKSQINWDDIKLLFKKPILDESEHFRVDGFANGWTLDPVKIKEKLPPTQYGLNSDGSINIRLGLYFRPQALFTASIASSLIIISICLAILVLARLNILDRFATSGQRKMVEKVGG